MKLKTIDKHGREEYNLWLLLCISLGAVLLNLFLGGLLIYHFEVGVEGSNVKTFEDCVWLAYMTVSTVGFGDHYPITLGGRLAVGFCILVGAINLGTFIGIGSQFVKTDSSVTNRQLMTILAEHTRMLQEQEKHLDIENKVSKNTHNLDKVICQDVIKRDDIILGYTTSGKDSSGLLVLSLDIEFKDGTILKRWIPADDEDHLKVLFNRGESLL